MTHRQTARVVMTEKGKQFTLTFISVLLGMVLAKVLRGTAISGIIMVVVGLFAIPILIILSVKCLGEKEWGGAAVSAAIAGILAREVSIEVSHCPWHQLPEEMDKLLNVLVEFFKGCRAF